jgi:hypothetical protein
VTRASGFDTFAATPSSANLAGLVSDETGTGALVFANSPTLVTPALGTPASGVVTNLTGTASININGTVGATTPSTGAFTTLSTTGSAGIGNVVSSNDKLRVSGTSTSSATTQGGVIADVTINASATTGAYAVLGRLVTAASSFTLGTGRGFRAEVPSLGAGSAVTNYHAFEAPSNTNTHTLNTAFRGSNADASGRYNLYMDGTAQNYLAGNVGIGTSSPTNKLDVKGNTVRFDGSGGGELDVNFQTTNTGSVRLNFGGTTTPTKGQILYSDNSDAFVFSTNSTERMRITDAGNVGIGTTTPGSKLHVNGELRIGNTVNTVSPTSPDRTITMVIGGTTYYIHAKTTND